MNKEQITRYFAKPKDWRAKGNMEFDELLSICLNHPRVGIDEVMSRQKFWYDEYRAGQKAQAVIVCIMSSLITGLVMSHSVISMCAFGIPFLTLATGLFLTLRREKVIKATLLDCYGWIINEVMCNRNETVTNIENASEGMAKAEAEDKADRKKFRRVICGFGYDKTTIAN